jgi:hypothetical protein
MVLQALSDYIENLCRRHQEVLHTDDECHYVNLNDDKKQTSLADEMHYPGVMFETSGYRFSGTGGDLVKLHNCRIEVWGHVEDTADYTEIENMLSHCNEIICDIFAMMIDDKRHRTQNVLNYISFDGVEVQDIQNQSNALYGCYADFQVPVRLCVADRLSHFNDN